MPESESALRKKCIELSPTFPLPSSTSKSVSVVATSRCNQNNNNQIKDCEQRNGMKSQFLRESSDCVNKTGGQIGDDNNDAIFALSSSTVQQENDTPKTTLKLTGFDKNFENSTTANTNDIDTECDKSSSNLECAPLIQLSPNKSITLVKQNSTSLIFTKKDVNPVVHRKRITLVCSSGTHPNSEITTTTTTAAEATTASPTEGIPIISHTNESISSPKKRHSFNWHSDRNSGFSPLEKSKRKQIKSWYAVIGSPSVRESAFDSDTEVRFHTLTQYVYTFVCMTNSDCFVIFNRIHLSRPMSTIWRIKNQLKQKKLQTSINQISLTHRKWDIMQVHTESHPDRNTIDSSNYLKI